MKVFATNPKATFDYQILEKLESGIVLSGHEVKAVKNNMVSIKGAFVKIIGAETYLVGATISPYQPGNVSKEYDPQRSRKLLLKRSELKYLIGKSQEPGIALVPIKIYSKSGLIKLELAIARGKKKYDKREAIKKRDIEKKMRTVLKY